MNNYDYITQIIIDKLEKGEIPWRNPFRSHGQPNRSWVSKKPYTGINAFMTSMMGYKSPYWMTFLQIKKAGAKLVNAKGTGVPIIFAKYIDKEDSQGNIQRVSVYKRSTVFNLQFVEGIECPVMKGLEDDPLLDFDPLENCDEFLMDIGSNLPPIEHIEETRAFYRPATDTIYIAEKELFKTEEDFYAVLFHEITHSTGHSSRCNRDLSGGKKSIAYAKEELVAEIGASFMCAETGVLNRKVEDHAAYIQHWLGHLKNDSKLIIEASSKAQKALDYLKTKKTADVQNV